MNEVATWLREWGRNPIGYKGSDFTDLTELCAKQANRLDEILERTHDPVGKNLVASAQHEQCVFQNRYNESSPRAEDSRTTHAGG